jgi:hypothetical protein
MKLFRKRYMIELLVLAGFAGFMLGCILLFGRDILHKGRESVFHEVAYDPRYIISSLVKERQKIEKDSAHRKYLDSLENAIGQINDSVLLGRLNRNLVSHLNSFELARMRIDTITKEDSTFLATTPVHWQFRDTSVKNFAVLEGNIRMPVNKFPSDVSFFVKYPGFAIWVLLILGFFSTLFIVLAICLFAYREIRNKVDLCIKGLITSRKYNLHYVMTFLILSCFLFMSYITFYDGEVVKDQYFFTGFRTNITVLVLFGYVVASFCFTGFMNAASYVDELQVRYNVAKRDKIEGPQTIEYISNCYETLKTNFDTYFVATSIILSFVVFCTGSLYTALNTMDFIRKLEQDFGFSPVRTDFVYVYGGLNTLLILLFLIPVKLKFASFQKDFQTEVTHQAPPEPGQAQKPVLKKVFAGSTKKVSDLLLAFSPILASLAQVLLDAIFN